MSLITYPVATDPRAFLPRSVSLAQDVNARSFASPFGGSEQAVDMLNDRWRLSMELPPCSQTDAARREAFINALRGQVNHTELYHFGRPYPQGTLASCQGLVYDAPQGADSITIATTAGATLLAGDMLGVYGLLLQCRADCTADANGLLVVPLTNRLRRAISGLRRASTAAYVDGSGVLQTAGVDVPRFQGGQLLVEGEGANLLTHSNNFSDVSWSKVNGSVTSGASMAPDGTMTAYRFTENTFTGQHWIGKGVGVDSGYASIFAKADTRSFIGIRRSSNSAGVVFDLSLGVVTSATAGYSGSVTPLAGGWFLCSAFGVFTGGAYFTVQPSSGVLSYAGDGSSGLFVWGADVSQTGGSYIPTTTTAATRAADIITPVVWQKPTAPFRLVGRPALRYVPGYSESLALDFVEKVD